MSVNAVKRDGTLQKIALGVNYQDFNALKLDISSNIELTDTAQKAYNEDDYFIMSTGQLVKAIDNIAVDDTIELNTNVIAVNVIELLAAKANIVTLGTAAYKNVGSANGVAELDTNGKVPAAQLPSFVDDVVEGYYDTVTDRFYQESTYETVITPVDGKSWVDVLTNKSYRWTGSVYTRVDEGVQLGETSSTAYRGDRGKTAYDHASDSNKIASAQTLGMYKIAVTAEGHISAVEAVDASSGSTPPGIVNMNVTQVNGISFGIEE